MKAKKKPRLYRLKKPADVSISAGDEAKVPPWLVPYQFKPGQSGNPKGPRVGLANEIRHLTGGGVEMAHAMIRIMRGERIPGVWGTPTYKDVRESALWLSEQCFGRAPLKINADGETYDLQRLLYVELSRSRNEPGVFDVPSEELLEQNLADQQPLQDPNKEPGRRKV